MIRTLKGRLILSHVLPLLTVLILAGFILNFVLETRFLLTNLAGEITGRAVLLADLATDLPDVWTSAESAQAFVDRSSVSSLIEQVMLFDHDGIPLAITNQANISQESWPAPALEDLEEVLAGEVVVHTEFSRAPTADVVEVLVPAWNDDGEVVGAIRLTRQLVNVYDQILTLRSFIVAVLAIGLLVGGSVALALGHNLGGSLQQVTKTIDDLASQKQLEQLPEKGPQEIQQLYHAVNMLVTRLQTLEQNRRLMLSNVVHELSNPLGALHSATRALLSGAAEDETLRTELLTGMKKEEGRLEQLLADLAGLYDHLIDSLSLQITHLDLRQTLQEMLPPWREVAQEKGLNWETGIPESLPVIEADENRLIQAVSNLINNAIKYTPPGGSVIIRAGYDLEWVWIEVQDTGPGILPEEQAKIFQPFYRGRKNPRFSEGMGLGLSIAQTMIQAHNGRITVDSTPGQGATITISLPSHDR